MRAHAAGFDLFYIRTIIVSTVIGLIAALFSISAAFIENAAKAVLQSGIV